MIFIQGFSRSRCLTIKAGRVSGKTLRAPGGSGAVLRFAVGAGAGRATARLKRRRPWSGVKTFSARADAAALTRHRPRFYRGKISFVRAATSTEFPDDPPCSLAGVRRRIRGRRCAGRDHLGIMTTHVASGFWNFSFRRGRFCSAKARPAEVHGRSDLPDSDSLVCRQTATQPLLFLLRLAPRFCAGPGRGAPRPCKSGSILR